MHGHGRARGVGAWCASALLTASCIAQSASYVDPDASGEDSDTRPSGCGDGIQDADEACDMGAQNGPGSACTQECEINECGDGILGPGEACDDDAEDCVGCLLVSCGDGVVNVGEACDDGNFNEDDGCTSLCRAPACGDGFTQPSREEECDDGANVDPDDGCTSECQAPACGDGYFQPNAGEACDDSNGDNSDMCTDACALAACGDTYVQPDIGEDCDDGNLVNLDGCTGHCHDVPSAFDEKDPADSETQGTGGVMELGISCPESHALVGLKLGHTGDTLTYVHPLCAPIWLTTMDDWLFVEVGLSMPSEDWIGLLDQYLGAIECPAGSVVTGFKGRQKMDDAGPLTELSLECSQLHVKEDQDELWIEPASPGWTAPLGDNVEMMFDPIACDDQRHANGVEVGLTGPAVMSLTLRCVHLELE